ncbi:MAG: KilA-N domain-containing protein [Candidatus Nomurabacteria bacterium]|jgi:hypothetical protein|nr:KilA-N domain-containing protein [Candidatus Nomurabacteria bacterium]
MKPTVKTEIIVNENKVSVMRVGNTDYISLTDLARFKNAELPANVIIHWLSNKDSALFVGLWETLNNPDFNLTEFREIKLNEIGVTGYTMSPMQWVKRTNAKGLISKGGRYATGTFAHPDIAFEFASWISLEFKLYLIKEFERLKQDEAYRNKIDWSVKRELAKTNYVIHTDAIKENLVPTLTEKQKKFVYADEADVLNVALFGMTAKEWRDTNPDSAGNVRDHTDILHLVVLINLENLNAEMIASKIVQAKRLERLNEIARKQLGLLRGSEQVKNLNEGEKV